MAGWMERIEAMLGSASDLDEFKLMLTSAFPELDTKGFADKIALAMISAHGAGRFDVEETSA